MAEAQAALSEDDDVVAVDGDAAATLMVFTRESNDACSGAEATAESVRSLRIDRRPAKSPVSSLRPRVARALPAPSGSRDGTRRTDRRLGERRTKPLPRRPPIEGWRSAFMTGDGSSLAISTYQADALIDAACDDRGCFSAALVRPSGG